MKHYFLYLIFIACTCAVFFCTCIALFGCSSPVMGDDEQILLSDSGITEQNAASWRIESGSDFDEKKSIIALELGAELISVQKNTPSYVMAYPIAADGHEAGMPDGAIPVFNKAQGGRRFCSFHTPGAVLHLHKNRNIGLQYQAFQLAKIHGIMPGIRKSMANQQKQNNKCH